MTLMTLIRQTFDTYKQLIFDLLSIFESVLIPKMSSIKMMPLALLDKCIGQRLWIIMKSKREFAGTLRGFDDFFNMVLENVT
jgi:hypothetical protein